MGVCVRCWSWMAGGVCCCVCADALLGPGRTGPPFCVGVCCPGCRRLVRGLACGWFLCGCVVVVWFVNSGREHLDVARVCPLSCGGAALCGWFCCRVCVGVAAFCDFVVVSVSCVIRLAAPLFCVGWW